MKRPVDSKIENPLQESRPVNGRRTATKRFDVIACRAENVFQQPAPPAQHRLARDDHVSNGVHMQCRHIIAANIPPSVPPLNPIIYTDCHHIE